MGVLSVISLALSALIFSAPLAMSADKIVVVPLNSSRVAGIDGQVQYNDSGKTAGAEIYYEKALGQVGIGVNSPSAKLEVRGEIKSTDSNGNNRLWGEGRPGVILNPNHTASAGYCETPQGIKFSLSEQFSSWTNAAAGCPAGTWVCSYQEIGEQPCPTTPLITSIVNCDGSSGYQDEFGWLADGDYHEKGKAKIAKVYEFDPIFAFDVCQLMFVWCCWE